MKSKAHHESLIAKTHDHKGLNFFANVFLYLFLNKIIKLQLNFPYSGI